MRYRGTRIDWDVDQLRKWVEEDGLTHQQIADILHLGPKVVSKAVIRFGIRSQRTGPRSGQGHPEWKGGKNIDKDGYILLYMPGHPMARKCGAGKGKYVLEHRLVMAEHIGRMLDPKEVVHHRNGNKQDNRIENLELFAKNSDHLRHELTGRVPNWSPEGRARMGNRTVRKLQPREPIQEAS